jgi:hypothetical protein
MGRAGRDFFRHDRGDHLLARIEAERPFHRNENIVGGRQIDVTAPDQTAVADSHDLLHLVDREIDARQHFHGIGGAGGRGDGARRGFRNRQPVRGDDWHHDHRGAVSRNAADTVLVDDDGHVPGQLRAGLRHRMRQREHFVAGHEAGGADQERRDLHVGITVVRDVIDDRADLGSVKRAALNLGAHRVEAVGRRSRRDGDETAGRFGEAAEGGFGEADFVGIDDTVVGENQRCQQDFRIAA